MLLCATASAPASQLAREGSRLVVSGELDGSSLPRFAEQLGGINVRTVVFENVSGGSAHTAADYIRLIRAAGVNTEVRGQCYAACAYAFLAGKEHRFGRGGQVNALLIPVAARPKPDELAHRWRGEQAHKTLAEFLTSGPDAASMEHPPTTTSGPDTAQAPAHDAATSTNPGPGRDTTSGSAAPSESASTPSATRKDVWQPDHGVLFTSTPTLFGRIYNTFYCDGNQGRDTSKCELLPDADPFKIGVLTP